MLENDSLDRVPGQSPSPVSGLGGTLGGTLSPGDQHKLAAALAEAISDADDAKVAAGRGGFPRTLVPEFKSALLFWTNVVEQASSGACDLARLLRSVALLRTHNTEVSRFIALLEKSTSASVSPDAQPARESIYSQRCATSDASDDQHLPARHFLRQGLAYTQAARLIAFVVVVITLVVVVGSVPYLLLTRPELFLLQYLDYVLAGVTSIGVLILGLTALDVVVPFLPGRPQSRLVLGILALVPICMSAFRANESEFEGGCLDCRQLETLWTAAADVEGDLEAEDLVSARSRAQNLVSELQQRLSETCK
jgi:Effector-associated domain 1